MTHGSTHVPSRGFCIYCGVSSNRLTDEHIVPLSLGGSHVLRGASCKQCANVTKKFEQEVARGLWGDARISYDAPSRRKKERPSQIILRDPEGVKSPIHVNYSDYPAQFVFYKMFPAGFLQGLPKEVDVSARWQMVTVGDDTRRDEFLERYPDRLVVKFKHVPNEFARLLAKIGYGQILTVLDPWDFDPVCLPYILGTQLNPSYIVGGKFEVDPPETGIGYRLQTACAGDAERMILVALIRLYANLHSPVYHCVVGEVRGAERTQAVIKKLGEGDFRSASLNGLPGLQAKSREHWVPQVWPTADFR